MKETATKIAVRLLFPLEWAAKRYAVRKMQRQWLRNNPYEMLAVFVALIKHNPEIATEFRRALRMQDAPKAHAEPRIVTPMEFAARRRPH